MFQYNYPLGTNKVIEWCSPVIFSKEFFWFSLSIASSDKTNQIQHNVNIFFNQSAVVEGNNSKTSERKCCTQHTSAALHYIYDTETESTAKETVLQPSCYILFSICLATEHSYWLGATPSLPKGWHPEVSWTQQNKNKIKTEARVSANKYTTTHF